MLFALIQDKADSGKEYRWARLTHKTGSLTIDSGFFVVPLNAFIQYQSPLITRGRYLGATNFVTFSAMFLASVALWLFKEPFGLNPAQLFLIMGVASIGATAYIIMTLPEAFVRGVNWILTHSFFKVTAVGKKHVPHEGGALLVCNHTSYLDPLIILASLYRPVRFLMYRSIYNAPLMSPIAKIMKAIPVSVPDSPRQILRALKAARKAIQSGELVCIFADGVHSHIAEMLPFQRAFRRVMRALKAPIIPVHLENVDGSIFGYRDGKYFWQTPRSIPCRVTVSFGWGNVAPR